MRILMIIPAYNEENNIKDTVNSIINLNNPDIDYIVINDGSTDNTLRVLNDNKFNFINLATNLGIGGAVQTGYKYALYHDYDIAIQFDGDGQHNSEYINALVKEIENGNDLVIGSRFITNLEGFKSTKMRRVGIVILSSLIKLCTGKKITDPTSGFRACNKKIINLFSSDYPTDYPEPDTAVKIIKKNFKVKEIPVIMNERKKGKSSINILKSVYYMVKVSLSIIISSITTKEEN